jgi:tetratricopeptide (TPR) repeat protein
MPWIPLLLVLVVVYVVVLVVRGIIQFVPWFMETFVEPRQLARLKKNPQPQSDDQARSSVPRRAEGGIGIGYREQVAFAALRASSGLTELLGFLKKPFTRKDFTYWVTSALGETDPDKKVKYCSRALRLDPGYEPAWGLKANTLLELKRYEEAVPCFDKVLAMRPSSLAWYRKGLCCYHLGQHEKAITCFDEALAACADKDRQLFNDASRQRKLAEEALPSTDLESGKC